MSCKAVPAVLVICVCTVVAAAFRPVVQTGIPDAKVSAQLDAFIAGALRDLDVVPGVSIAVVRGDATIYAKGHGLQNVATRRPVDSSTVFYTASMIKAFTGMTAAVLASEGTLNLDASLETYLLGLRLPKGADAHKATLRGLLSHNAGFGSSTVNYVSTFVRKYSTSELIDTLNVYSQPLPAFQYANANFVLVGYAIEKATGRSWPSVMTDKLLRPLGMRRSTLRVPAEGGFARPHVAEADGFHLIPFRKSDATITPAGGIFTTAADVARFVRASLHDGRLEGRQVLPAEAVRLQQRQQVATDATFGDYRRSGYGLGLYLATYDGEPMHHHFGGIAGYRAHMSWLPGRQIGVVVLVNEGGDGSRFADLLANYAYDVLLGRDADARASARIAEYKSEIARAREQRRSWQVELARARASRAAPALTVAAYAGEYRSERLGPLTLSLTGEGLHAQFGDQAGDLVAIGGHQFFVDWNPGAAPDRWTFQVTGDRVAGFDWGGRAFVRQ